MNDSRFRNYLVLPKEMEATEGTLPKNVVDAIIEVGLKAWNDANGDTEFKLLGHSFSVKRSEPFKCVIRLLVKD